MISDNPIISPTPNSSKYKCQLCLEKAIGDFEFEEIAPGHFTKYHKEVCIEQKWPLCVICTDPCWFPTNELYYDHLMRYHQYSSMSTDMIQYSIKASLVKYNGIHRDKIQMICNEPKCSYAILGKLKALLFILSYLI